MSIYKISMKIKLSLALTIVLAMAGLFSNATFASGDHSASESSGSTETTEDAHPMDEMHALLSDHELLPYELELTIPHMDSAKGKELFVEKACITCHAINGVGGEDAPQIDAHVMTEKMGAFEIAAKMWNHSQGMVALQIAAFDEQVMLSGDDLANITAFLHDDEMQHSLMLEDIPHDIQEMMEHGH